MHLHTLCRHFTQISFFHIKVGVGSLLSTSKYMDEAVACTFPAHFTARFILGATEEVLTIIP